MKLTESPKSEKKIHLERLLAKGTVMIFVDSRRPEVVVPPTHQNNVQLLLNLDYAFEIPDFKIADDHIEASLSFNRQNFFCIIPLDAIYAFNSKVLEEIVVFPEDVPQGEAGTLLGTPPVAAAPSPELVPPTPDAASQEAPPTPEAKPRRGHLRLVK